MEKQMTPKQAIDILATAIMKRVNGTGEEHTIYNVALNTLLALLPKEEKEDK